MGVPRKRELRRVEAVLNRLDTLRPRPTPEPVWSLVEEER